MSAQSVIHPGSPCFTKDHVFFSRRFEVSNSCLPHPHVHSSAHLLLLLLFFFSLSSLCLYVFRFSICLMWSENEDTPFLLIFVHVPRKCLSS